jgi:hypothetical protein
MTCLASSPRPMVRLRLAWHGRPETDAEPLAPTAWRLAVHRHPRGDRFWMVSDIETGRMVACDVDRERAIDQAHARLNTLAKTQRTTVQALLEQVRASARAEGGGHANGVE